MNREEKAAVIDQIADELGNSDAIFALDYRGITVGQIAELREKLRSTDTKLRVAKNSLSERAADQAGVADIKPMLIGPTALALVKGDAAAAAKILSDTARALRGPLEFKGGLMSGSVMTAADLDAIAKLPSRDVLNAQLVGTIAAPLTGLARTLNALIAGVAIQLGQIRDQGLVSGTSAPAAASSADHESASETTAAAEEETAPAAAEAAEVEDAPAANEETQAAEAAPAAESATDDDAADGATEADLSSAEEAPSAEA
jgi:large subunit ribosomal protein L10